ncbi:sulfurtransferase complex subunit TusD [Kushneria phosphatilytica]|uniref:Sulfurtransferase complex subunit TusD n=1 Tax=Kushneria phosphatilytica TaxID=657387 RepID=A0A1S1NYH4_9GAMM|nr:sulfurtransferase complex subunit TusD [Kushneria phosphatilytica]OHV11903.1 sulfurtransferase TusD [Kushneria phosphatilytica]QEL11077.1 sulfurtransferase complex subunit TusD [Kushneria phosphatilytica]
MNYALLVLGGPYSQQAAHSALRFAMALPQRGHRVGTVFFYHEGVYNAARLMTPPRDEPHLLNHWRELHDQQQTQLFVCVASALRRGLLDTREAQRHDMNIHTLEPPFELTGLGQLIEIGLSHDRFLTFAP